MTHHCHIETTSDTLTQALKLLEESSLRKTQGRVALLEILIEKHGPFSVEEIHHFVQSKKMDLATVYRCLTAFEEISLVRRCDFGDGIARYELHLGSGHHHHHVICKICRKSEKIDDCEVAKLETLVEKKGYTRISHNLEFFGICRQCERN